MGGWGAGGLVWTVEVSSCWQAEAGRPQSVSDKPVCMARHQTVSSAPHSTASIATLHPHPTASTPSRPRSPARPPIHSHPPFSYRQVHLCQLHPLPPTPTPARQHPTTHTLTARCSLASSSRCSPAATSGGRNRAIFLVLLTCRVERNKCEEWRAAGAHRVDGQADGQSTAAAVGWPGPSRAHPLLSKARPPSPSPWAHAWRHQVAPPTGTRPPDAVVGAVGWLVIWG